GRGADGAPVPEDLDVAAVGGAPREVGVGPRPLVPGADREGDLVVSAAAPAAAAQERRAVRRHHLVHPLRLPRREVVHAVVVGVVHEVVDGVEAGLVAAGVAALGAAVGGVPLGGGVGDEVAV